MTRIISVVNRKGGATKTTVASQLAYGLHRRGLNVIAVDMDPQGNLTKAMGLSDSFAKGEGASQMLLSRAITRFFKAKDEGGRWISVVPADKTLVATERALNSEADWQMHLRQAVKDALGENSSVDFVIIDSPPNLGYLTINGLAAADEVIIPVTCDTYSFDGLADLTETISIVKRNINHTLSLLGVVATRVQRQRKIDRDSLVLLKEMFPTHLFKATIPENTALKEAGGKGKSIWDYRSDSLAVPAFEDLCTEIIERSPV
jgi:chromosome partitioning protein